MFSNQEISKSQTPFSLKFNNATPRNRMDAFSIATLVPEEMPNNFMNILEDRNWNVINRKVINWDREKRGISQSRLGCHR